jgi:hypothetical protein
MRGRSQADREADLEADLEADRSPTPESPFMRPIG